MNNQIDLNEYRKIKLSNRISELQDEVIVLEFKCYCLQEEIEKLKSKESSDRKDSQGT